MKPPSNRPLTLLALAGCLLLAAPFAISSCVLPWGRDQGIYAHAATRMLDGFIPYAETFVFKPPATIFLHAAAIQAFGRDMLAIRQFDALWTLATATLLFLIVHVATGTRVAALFSGAAFAWQIHRESFWNSAQTDGWVNLPFGVTIAALVVAPATLTWAVVAGIAMGVACCFKYTVGALLPIAMLLPFIRSGRSGWRAGFTVGLAFVITLGLGAATMAACGALDDFLDIQNEVVVPYSGASDGLGIARKSWSQYIDGVGRFGTIPLTLAGLGVFIVLVDALIRRRHDARSAAGLAAVGWAFAGLASAFVQGKFFGYQYLATVGALGLLIPIGLSGIAQWLPRPRIATLLAGSIVLYLAAQESPFPKRWQIIAQLAKGTTTLEREYEVGKYGFKDMSLNANVTVAKWLLRETPVNEPIFIWGYDPMIYVLANRGMVSRFAYTYPMVVPWAPVDRYKAELMDSLRATPPSAVVVGSDDGVRVVMGHRKDSQQTLQEFPELQSFIHDGYAPPVAVGRFQVYRRRPADITTPSDGGRTEVTAPGPSAP